MPTERGHRRPVASDGEATQRRMLFLVGAAGALYLAAYGAGLALAPGEAYLRLQSNVIYNIPALAALGLSIMAVRRSGGRERLGWLCLAALLASWQVGDWTYTHYDYARGSAPPFPGFADAAYYAGYLAYIAAIPLLVFPKRRLYDRRWVLDGGIIIVVAGAIAWEYTLEPIVTAGGYAPLHAAIALGYPLLDLGLLAALVVTLYASGGRVSARALLLGAATAANVFGDAVYTYLVSTVGYDTVGNPLELTWLVAYVLIGVSAVLPEEAPAEGVAPRQSLLGLLLPYTAALPLASLAVVAAARGELSPVISGGAIAAVALVLARQFLTLRDNLALYRDLEREEARLLHAANHDALTGVFNRRRFHEAVEAELSRARQHGTRAAVLLLDLDDFKAVNDSLGHRTGDVFLTSHARALGEQLREGGVLARLGGDEFAVLLPATDARGALVDARGILRTLRQHMVIVDGRPLRTTASVGVALLPEHGASADELLAHADLAMYEAKERGRNAVALYEPRRGGPALTESRLHWKRRIGEALEKDLFRLYCQPIIDLRTGRVEQHEVLLRMKGRRGELVLPGAFLDVAERYGLIGAIDRWVVRQTIGLIGAQQRAGRRLQLAVNVSGKSLAGGELLQVIRGELAASGVDPASLVLEITETGAIADMDQAQEFLRSVKALGCRFALDDFGAGFSSFYHVKHLPVDYLKIDGSFIRHLPQDPADQYLVKAMAELAKGLGRQTIAEFVGDDETVRLLREIGIDFGQGYYLGRPAPAAKALAALADAA